MNMIEHKKQYDQGDAIDYNSWKHNSIKIPLSTKCTKQWWKLNYLKF